MIKKKQQRRFDRFRNDPAVPSAQGMASVSSVVAAGTKVTVNFSSQIQLSGTQVPTSWFFGTGNQQPTSIFAFSPTSITFNLPGTVAAAQPYNIDPYDPAVRTPTGGFVGGSSGAMV